MASHSDAPSVRSVAGWWQSPTTARNGLVVLLTIVPGFADAISYLDLGRVFTANMTGNTILLGLAIGLGEPSAAWRSVAALVGFALGVVLASMIVERTRERTTWPTTVTAALACEGILLLVFTLWGTIAPPDATGGAIFALIVVLAMAMGTQSVAVHVLGISGVATTAVTVTWVGVVSGLTGRFHMVRELHERAAAESNNSASIRVQVMVISVYLVAAVLAAVAQSRWHLAVAALPTGVVVFVVIVALRRFRDATSS